MSLTPLYLLGAALACAVYWAAARLQKPEPAGSGPVRPPGLLAPLEAYLEGALRQARWRIAPRTLVRASLVLAALGVTLARPLQNPPLTLVSAGVLGLLPHQAMQARIRRRRRAVQAAVGPALAQIARLADLRPHPFLALTDALPILQPPLKAEFDLVLIQAQAGLPLPEALRDLAGRCGGNFYLHELAELVAVHIREGGGDLAGSLNRLSARYRAMEELRAEEATELLRYQWLTRLLFIATLAPLLYWAITGSAALQTYIHEPAARWVLLWVVLTGLVIASLPYWPTTGE